MKNGSLVVFFLLSFSLGFVYLFFISDYSLVELRKKEAHLDFLKNSFYQEKSEHEYLLRLQKNDDKTLTKYLNEYGFIKNDEILVDIRIPENDSFFKGEEDVFFYFQIQRDFPDRFF